MKFTYIFLFIALTACIQKEEEPATPIKTFSSELDPSEDIIISIAGMNPDIVGVIKSYTGNPIEPLQMGNEFGDLDSSDYSGICSRLSSDNEFEVLDEIIQKVNDPSYSVICYYGDEMNPYIALIKESNALKFIEIRGTQAFNYDMESEDIIQRLEHWQKKYDLRLIGVARDYIDIEFAKPPKHAKAFKLMVSEFCPDAIDWLNDDENVLLMDEGGTYLNLWWD